MVVQHNMQAMNANRMLGITAGSQAKSTEKLSSGYKINRAADNAAGLAISEKMRKQIRGLDQASANAQDGISAVQTAEGALNEVQDMLQRMNELAVQSANGTNSVSDRQSIQDEIDQLTTEIDRVSETTKFNEAYLLKGDAEAPNKYRFTYNQVASPITPAVDMDGTGNTTYTDAGTQLTVDITTINTTTNNGDMPSEDINNLLKSLKDQGFSAGAVVRADSSGTGVEVAYSLELNGEAAKNYSVNLQSGGSATGGVFEIVNRNGDVVMEVTVGGGNLQASSLDDIGNSASCVATAMDVTAASIQNETNAFYDKDGNKISENALKDYFSGTGHLANSDNAPVAVAGKRLYDAVGHELYVEDLITNGELSCSDELVGDLKLKLHVGADATSNNQITINLQAMSSKGLGVNGLKVNGDDDTNARNAIETIKSALSTVSAQRSELGAAQNRLEHTIANLDNIVENTTSAESQIRDTDMAEEMVKYSKSNILAQAGQSMLAQANQSNQGVLSLLG